MRSRAFRSIAVLLGILLLANSPANAGPVTIVDVLQTIGSYQNPPSLRLRDVYRKPVASSTLDENADQSAIPTTSSSLFSGLTFDTQDPQKAVAVVVPGDVEGSVCDCGVVTVAAGFPKWPLLFLAAVPLFFIKDKDDDIVPNPTPTPTPTPTPPPTPTPEPASLLLFGSGLAAVGAQLRRRRMKAKLKLQRKTTEEG